VNMHYNT